MEDIEKLGLSEEHKTAVLKVIDDFKTQKDVELQEAIKKEGSTVFGKRSQEFDDIVFELTGLKKGEKEHSTEYLKNAVKNFTSLKVEAALKNVDKDSIINTVKSEYEQKINILSGELDAFKTKLTEKEKQDEIRVKSSLINKYLPKEFTHDSELMQPHIDRLTKSILDKNENLQEIGGKLYVGTKDISAIINEDVIAKYVKSNQGSGFKPSEASGKDLSLIQIKATAKTPQEVNKLLQEKVLSMKNSQGDAIKVSDEAYVRELNKLKDEYKKLN